MVDRFDRRRRVTTTLMCCHSGTAHKPRPTIGDRAEDVHPAACWRAWSRGCLRRTEKQAKSRHSENLPGSVSANCQLGGEHQDEYGQEDNRMAVMSHS